jgi:hypothetical protein
LRKLVKEGWGQHRLLAQAIDLFLGNLCPPYLVPNRLFLGTGTCSILGLIGSFQWKARENWGPSSHPSCLPSWTQEQWRETFPSLHSQLGLFGLEGYRSLTSLNKGANQEAAGL